ncbi:MAG TPA: thrombospondin type 3 repeat-containing protein [Candidatus Nanoarchaeia archaeon]|nr:thrombospondin type 3 repeat-containing protein [Candidatus Nanoarchaeia archaeon]
MKHAAVIYGVCLLFFLTPAFADTRPDIRITFYERVNESTVTINLTDVAGTRYDTVLIDSFGIESDNPTFIYKPAGELTEGRYHIKAYARDMHNVWGPQVEQDFMATISDLNINIVRPRFGVTNTTTFDLEIGTDEDRNAVCKYGWGYSFYDFSLNLGGRHIKNNISITSSSNIQIRCVDKYNKTYQIDTQIKLDETYPSIRIEAEDVVQMPLLTPLRVYADEEVICRYGYNPSSYSLMTPFEGYREDNLGDYIRNPVQTLGMLQNGKTYTFSVICKDLAGKASNMAITSFKVDLSAEPTVAIRSPAGVLLSRTFYVNASTNKDASCKYSRNQTYTDFGEYGKSHLSNLIGPLVDGSYTYNVDCVFSTESGPITKRSSTSFVIDSTKPNMTYVNITNTADNDSNRIYSDDEICAEWDAVDSESAISSYKYYVFLDKTQDQLIDQGDENPESSKEYCIDTSLNNSEKYYLKVQAQNAAGLWSENKSSISVLVDTSLSPPGCDNGRRDGTETDKDCGGSCDGCVLGLSCRLNSDCETNFCNASSKCAKASCGDQIKNGDESDVDCGGSCKKCSQEKSCKTGKDCESNNCQDKKCEEVLDKCENNRWDESIETDIDCGGKCPECSIGAKCISDLDCGQTAECKDKKCLLKATDKDKDGITDDNDNCADVPNKDQSDADKDGIGDECDLDSDNDNMPDSFEEKYFDCKTCAKPDEDLDGDGLLNLEEYQNTTDPTNPDTDGDGFSDKEEITQGSDPLDPTSTPDKGGGFFIWVLIFLLIGALGAGGFYGYKLLTARKPFIPPSRGEKGQNIFEKKPLPKLPIRPPIIIPHPPVQKPAIKPPIALPPAAKPKPAPAKTKKEPKKEIDVFKKLATISRAERIDQAKGQASSMSNKELNEKINKLKQQLK